MKITCQYLAKGKDSPDAITFSDAGFDLPPGMAAPVIGDCIMIPTAYPEKDKYKKCTVVSRRFAVNTDGTVQDEIVLVVVDSEERAETYFRD